MPGKTNKSLMRSLGEFFGHITRAVKDPADGSEVREVKREITEETRDTPAGKVTLRRTTIEEVEFHPDTTQSPPAPSKGPDAQ